MNVTVLNKNKTLSFGLKYRFKCLVFLEEDITATNTIIMLLYAAVYCFLWSNKTNILVFSLNPLSLISSGWDEQLEMVMVKNINAHFFFKTYKINQ